VPRKTDHLKPHQFKPGQSGNPKGRTPLSEKARELRKLTIESYRKVIELVMEGNLLELKALAEDPETSALQVGIATSVMKAIQAGDYIIIERIAERIIGKIPEVLQIDPTSNVNVKISVIDKDMLKKANEELEKSV
jgi:hypothetical protein